MRVKLSAPSPGIARRVTAEVGFEDRLTGFRFRPGKGFQEVACYGFEEVLGLLAAPAPWIEPGALETWVREKMGDPELADAIGEAFLGDAPLLARFGRVRGLMVQRLLQCLKGVSISGPEAK